MFGVERKEKDDHHTMQIGKNFFKVLSDCFHLSLQFRQKHLLKDPLLFLFHFLLRLAVPEFRNFLVTPREFPQEFLRFEFRVSLEFVLEFQFALVSQICHQFFPSLLK